MLLSPPNCHGLQCIASEDSLWLVLWDRVQFDPEPTIYQGCTLQGGTHSSSLVLETLPIVTFITFSYNLSQFINDVLRERDPFILTTLLIFMPFKTLPNITFIFQTAEVMQGDNFMHSISPHCAQSSKSIKENFLDLFFITLYPEYERATNH